MEHTDVFGWTRRHIQTQQHNPIWLRKEKAGRAEQAECAVQRSSQLQLRQCGFPAAYHREAGSVTLSHSRCSYNRTGTEHVSPICQAICQHCYTAKCGLSPSTRSFPKYLHCEAILQDMPSKTILILITSIWVLRRSFGPHYLHVFVVM